MNLKPFVNDKGLWVDFVETLEKKISVLHRTLEQMDELKDIHRVQGEIRALQKLKKLRDEVNG